MKREKAKEKKIVNDYGDGEEKKKKNEKGNGEKRIRKTKSLEIMRTRDGAKIARR